MRARIVTVVLVAVLAGLGVPSATADEPAESPPPTSAVETTPSGDESDAATDPPAEPAAPPPGVPIDPPPAAARAVTLEPTDDVADDVAPPAVALAIPTHDPTDEVADDVVTPSADAGEPTGDEQRAPEPEVAAADTIPENDPRASVGDVDCTTMTVPVTLDNTRSVDAATFDVLAGDQDAEEPAFEETVEVPAGDTRVVAVPVSEDTQITVLVFDEADGPQGQGGGDPLAFAIVQVDCAPDGGIHDPRARIGGVDCTTMTVDVTLDNSRSLEESTYFVAAGGVFEDTFEESFDLAAGATLVVEVPVEENSSVTVQVASEALDEESGGEVGLLALELFSVDCVPGQDEPRVVVGVTDCATLTIPVDLDNRRSDTEVRFGLVAAAYASDAHYHATVTVPAGEQRIVRVPARSPETYLEVIAEQFFGGGNDLHQLPVHCARPAARPIPRVAPRNVGLLADTGAHGLLVLPYAALLLLGTGGALTVAGRRR